MSLALLERSGAPFKLPPITPIHPSHRRKYQSRANPNSTATGGAVTRVDAAETEPSVRLPLSGSKGAGKVRQRALQQALNY